MNSDFTAPRRLHPLHTPASQAQIDGSSDRQSALQQDEAASELAQEHAPSKSEDYTISVEHVRDHFRSKGLTKSKDTVQRWCRSGDLDCQKLGLLNRYFTTETSLLELERKLLPDMIAENAGASVTQPCTATFESETKSMPLNTPADTSASSDLQADEANDAAARSDMKASEASGQNSIEELAKLRAENSGLREQLNEAKDNAQFLREEIISSRGQRGDVVKIAEQMLGTLETIAVGGRLERPARQGSQRNPNADTDPMIRKI